MPRYLVTSALPYINGVKHLGNLVGSQLPSDVYARYLRQRGEEVLLICATDEHGTPAELAALEAGLEVAEYCRQQHAIQAELARRWQLSFDHFGRSSSAQNRQLTQQFARKLEERGYIEERVTRQVYSVTDERFLPDRYIIGTCPHCGYPAARGDQCENCTRVLDPVDLIDPRSAVSGSTDLEIRESRHLFLLVSKLAPELRAWIESKMEWPVLATSIALKWLDEGLHDRGITRDLKWGVPVDRPGFEDKVFYVWFDAPIEYVGATWEWADAAPTEGRDWKSWWYGADDVTYVQFMAKDNVPFHTVFWPGTIIGSGEPWTQASYIKAFNWLDYYGKKFSTSRHIGVFMDDAVELLPADYWRWFLMANAPETSDSTFTWELFASSVNKDLADTLGNFINRSLRFAASRFGDEVPAGGEAGEAEAWLVDELGSAIARYSELLGRMQFRKAATELRAIWALGNAYLDRTAPWQAVRDDPTQAAGTMRVAINLIRIFAVLAAPIIPSTSASVLAALGRPDDDRAWISSDIKAELEVLTPGQRFEVPPVLFRKVADEEIAAWTARFGGEGEEGG